MIGIRYSEDLIKHYVRKYGWLPACLQQAQRLDPSRKKIPLRYFTFCASEAIDVFMLEKAGVISRGNSGRLNGVYFCEKDDVAFGIIEGLIGSPDQGFRGEFSRIVLFQDDEDTVDRELYTGDDTPYSSEVRRKLDLKDAHLRLRKAAPFDIINLDIYGAMFPPKKQIPPPLLESIMQILKWQADSPIAKSTPLSNFTLFITSHIDITATKHEVIGQFASIISDNLSDNADFRSAFHAKFSHSDASILLRDNFAEFFSIALHKRILAEAILDFGWDVRFGPLYLYERDAEGTSRKQSYTIMHSISAYTRISNFKRDLHNRGVPHYNRAVSQLMSSDIIWVNGVLNDPLVVDELKSDLASIIAFRDQMRGG